MSTCMQSEEWSRSARVRGWKSTAGWREMEQRPQMRLGDQLHDSGTSTALRIISTAHNDRVESLRITVADP